jgi:pimeloyl-ACP methyl ester carboxylesterase
MIELHEISAASAKLNNAQCGTGPRRTIFLHGVLRRWQTFLPLLPSWTASGSCVAIDLPGHGDSSRLTAGYRVADYLVEVVALVRSFEHPVVVYGHSLGAMLAAGVADELPQQVRAVILEDPPFHTMGQRIRETRWQSYFTGLRPLVGSSQSVKEIVARLAAVEFSDPVSGETFCLGRQRDAAALRFMADCLKRVDPRVIEPIVEGRWLEGYDPRQVLERIECPVLLMQADPAAGGMLSDADVELAKAIVRDLSCVRLAGAPHLLHGTRTQDVLNLAWNFLATIEPD